jgi:aminoglycoside phosphotransferase (APT) family kinase protein
MNEQLRVHLLRHFSDASDVVIEGFMPIPGGFSRETYRFDAHVHRDGTVHVMPMILRKDPDPAAALLQTSRQHEHELIEAIRAHTNVPVSTSYFAVMDPEPFGQPAMFLQRVHGSGLTSALFHEGADADQADDVIRHLCEVLVELHTADVKALAVDEMLSDPRRVGIDTSTWDSYMDTTYAYYLDSFREFAFDPAVAVYLDAFLTMRRNRPRPLRLSLVHGDFNPANFLYESGRVTALIDWENSRIGDPREDLGWMKAMDVMSNTAVMDHPRGEGGFLAYYNKLTGWDVTEEELGYFSLFGASNIVVPVAQAMKRRVTKEHMQLLHLYLMQPSVANLVTFSALLKYPGVG